MELLVNPISLSNAIQLINMGVHQISLGLKDISVRSSCLLNMQQIKQVIKMKKKTKVLILINAFFFEQDIDKLTKYIIQLSKLPVDGFIFSDMAVNQICYENKIKTKLIYNPETLVTNYGQFEFYKQNNISEVSLARELGKNEIKEIAANKKTMRLQMQVEGHAYVMHSRWKLVTNFVRSTNIKENLIHQPLLIREVTRKNPMIAYEDIHGTHIFTQYDLCLVQQINELYQCGIDTIRIDTLFHSAEWVIERTKIYLDLIYALNKKQNISELLSKQKQQNCQSKGFYEINTNNLIYLDKVREYE